MKFIARIVLVMVSFTAVTVDAQNVDDRIDSHEGPPRPRFPDYRVKKIYHGPPASPIITGDFRFFRTRIREGAKSEVEFAGHYTVPRWGCGTECNGFVIVDSIRGKVYEGFGVAGLPFDWVADHGGDDAQPRMEFYPDSRLFKINGCPDEENCGLHDYEMIDGKGLKLLRIELLPKEFPERPPAATGQPSSNQTVLDAYDSQITGEYLVESVAICFECHSERDFSKPGWPIPPGRKGSGRILRGEGTADLIVAPNISPDKETGIGAWTDDEIKRAIIGGIGRDGRRLHPEMPYLYFNLLSAPELDAIVHHLRSIPPVHNVLPKMPKYVPSSIPPRVPMNSIQLIAHSDAVKRGQYLVRLAGCETCHTPRSAEGFIHGMEFAGGSVFRHAQEEADAASNLTPDPTGIGNYTEQQFIAVIRTGHSGGRQINSAMPWYLYRNMTDSDLKTIFAYLRALPPISHRIDNTQPPSPCPRCHNQHGLGNQN